MGANPAFVAGATMPASRHGPSGFNQGEGPVTVGGILGALDVEAAVIDDVTQIIQRTPYIIRAHASHFSTGLLSELAEAVDLLSVKITDVEEAHGAGR